MHYDRSVKLAILRANPNAIAVYDRGPDDDHHLYVLVARNHGHHTLNLPAHVHPHQIITRDADPITDLRLPAELADVNCYDEPIPGGVQIQPAGQPWVGTLGAACSFHDQAGKRRWGILSNWHVMCPTPTAIGHAIHQPRDTWPACAHLTDWEPVHPDGINEFDAAVADAKIDHLHTVTPRIRLTGPPHPLNLPPVMGLQVRKTGRTTDLTYGQCVAIDACVRVSYGNFTANFCNQALFEADRPPFSAAGDSGSLILTKNSLHPTALLFAGNNEITVGSPLDPIINRFNLSFKFPE